MAKVQISFKDKVFMAEIKDHAVIAEIGKRCPMTISLERESGNPSREYLTRFKDKVNISETEMTSKPQKNGIYYFKEWNAVNIVLCDCNIAPFKLAYLGEFLDNIADELKESNETITIESIEER